MLTQCLKCGENGMWVYTEQWRCASYRKACDPHAGAGEGSWEEVVPLWSWGELLNCTF